MKQKDKSLLGNAVLAIAIVAVAAGLSYLWNDTTSQWYTFLKKPAFQPPDQVFFLVWIVLYLLVAIDLFLLLRIQAGARILYPLVLMLVLGALWNFAFFGKENAAAGVIILAFAVTVNIYTIWQSYRIKPLYGLLLLPLLLWQTYALVLNYVIYMIN